MIYKIDKQLLLETMFMENDYADAAADKFADKVEDEPVPETIKTVGKMALGTAAVLGGAKFLTSGPKTSSTPKRSTKPTTSFGR